MEELGLNPILLVAQLISFGVLFVVLKKFLYNNLAKSLSERREGIRQIGVKTNEVEKKLVDLESQKSELVKKNQVELRKIILETQKKSEDIKKEILEAADEKSRKMITDAIAQIEQEKIKASSDLKNEASKLAKEMATKILTAPTNAKMAIDMSISELKKFDRKKA